MGRRNDGAIPDVKEVIKTVKESRGLGPDKEELTKQELEILRERYNSGDMEVDSYLAKQYEQYMSKYTKYCIESERENWEKCIKGLIFFSGIGDDLFVVSDLASRECTGEIMEAYAQGKSTKKIKELVYSFKLSGLGISYIGQQMLEFSPYGVEFVRNIFGNCMPPHVEKAYNEKVVKSIKEGLPKKKAKRKPNNVSIHKAIVK